MTHWPLLSLVTFLPLVGAAFIMLARGDEHVVARNARNIALSTSLIVFVLSLLLWIGFDPTAAGFQFVEQADWISIGGFDDQLPHGDRRHFAVLRAAVDLVDRAVRRSRAGPACTIQVKEYMIAFLVLETMMVGIFCALDFVLFYVFFEGVLVPMFLIIGIWGGPRRIYAAFKFFLYTLLGSVLSLLAILAVYFQTGSTDIVVALNHAFPPESAEMAVARVFRLVRGQGADVAGAHLAARRACRGADRRLGHPGRRAAENGRLRVHPLLAADVPAGLGVFHAADVRAVSAIAVIYTSFVALAQTDMKKLIAYSSIAHMGFVTMGIFAATSEAVQGAIDPDAEPRLRLGRAVPVRRRRL